MVHTTFVLETECLVSNWHVVRLPPNSAKRCWALQAITMTMCNAKVGSNKHGTLAPTYKGLKKEFHSTNNVEYEFWFCHDDIKRCVSGTKKKYVLDWPTVPNTWGGKDGYQSIKRGGVGTGGRQISTTTEGGIVPSL